MKSKYASNHYLSQVGHQHEKKKTKEKKKKKGPWQEMLPWNQENLVLCVVLVVCDDDEELVILYLLAGKQ